MADWQVRSYYQSHLVAYIQPSSIHKERGLQPLRLQRGARWIATMQQVRNMNYTSTITSWYARDAFISYKHGCRYIRHHGAFHSYCILEIFNWRCFEGYLSSRILSLAPACLIISLIDELECRTTDPPSSKRGTNKTMIFCCKSRIPSCLGAFA
jgi:hypothetical protein